MTAPADLTAVKAMLVDALQDAMGGKATIANSTNPAVGDSRFGITQHVHDYPTFIVNADKLAATVAEWFAKNQNT